MAYVFDNLALGQQIAAKLSPGMLIFVIHELSECGHGGTGLFLTAESVGNSD